MISYLPPFDSVSFSPQATGCVPTGFWWTEEDDLQRPERSECKWTLREVYKKFRQADAEKTKSASAVARYIDLWDEFDADLELSQFTSQHLRDFQQWLEKTYPLPKGASSINKTVDEIRRVLAIAKAEGIEVGQFRLPKKHHVAARLRLEVIVSTRSEAAGMLPYMDFATDANSIEGQAIKVAEPVVESEGEATG